MARSSWSPQEIAWLLDHQAASHAEFLAAGFDRSNPSWNTMRRDLRRQGLLTETAATSNTDRPLRVTFTDKRKPRLKWREVNRLMALVQDFREEVAGEQHFARIEVDTDRPFPVLCLSDLHVGSVAVWYDGLERLTDQILAVPDLRVLLLGDVANAAIRSRGIAENRADFLSFGEQVDYVRDWLEELDGRVLAAVWGNHETQREEELTGSSSFGRLFAEKTVYSPGICHIDLRVGEVEYRVAVTHKLGRNKRNPAAPAANYIRDNPSIDVAMAGDSHEPGLQEFAFDGRKRVAVNTGSLSLKDAYARRHFSLRTEPVFPVVVFNPRRHSPAAFWTVDDWLDSTEG